MIWWFSIGTLYLVYLTWQDYKNNMLVDDRYNWFMMGSTYPLLAWYKHNFFYILTIILVAVVLLATFKKSKYLGDADIKSLMWITVGFGIINIWLLAYFLMAFTIVMSLHYVVKKFVFKYSGPVQGYPVIFIPFMLITIIYNL